jgi:hypothetical protein
MDASTRVLLLFVAVALSAVIAPCQSAGSNESQFPTRAVTAAPEAHVQRSVHSDATGIGTAGRIAKWVDSGTLGNSIMSEFAVSGASNTYSVLQANDAVAHVLVGSGADFIGPTQAAFGATVGNGTSTPVHLFFGAQDGLAFVGTQTPTKMSFVTNNATKMVIDGFGRVGIDNLNPLYALEIGSDAQGAPAANVYVHGELTATAVIGAVYQDVAEWVPATEHVVPGTVVIVSGKSGNTVSPSDKAYDTRVAGVVSEHPGVLLGVPSRGSAKVATTGRVRVRVDASLHAIEIGDLLVTSDVPGTAMASQPIDVGGVKLHRPGTLIGKALEPLTTGTGEILVLLSLQ